VIDEQYDDQSDSLSIASPKHEHITLEENFTYRCCECSIDFGDSEALKIHYESKHAKVIHGWESFGLSEIALFDTTDEEVEEDAGTYPQAPEPLQTNKLLELYRCCGCMLIFDTDADLQQHSETVHASNALQVDGDNAWQCNEKHICSECGKAVHSAAYLVSHMRLHSKELPFTCTLCGARFKLVRYLKWHMAMHKGLYKCKQCDSSYKSPSELQEHMNRHTGTRAFCCFLCGNGFHNKKNLNKHLRMVHSHYYMRVMQKNSTKINHINATYVIVHLPANSGHEQIVHVDPNSRKKYICNVCGAKVLSSSYLKVHMRLHSKENPYSCNLCGARFKVARYLKWHLRKHKELYPCKQCGLSCQSYSLLQDHMKTHFVGRKYSCTFCPKFFCQKPGLINHLNKVHKSE
uniref:C2H2-type domain-containing protein n=1 Tax=Anopheles quadriannulatus TaxID=34691 RepID=A0A182WT41_ANOQN